MAPGLPISPCSDNGEPQDPSAMPDTSGALPERPMKLQRHWLTGKWQEVPYETDGGRVVYATEGGREAVKVLERVDYNRVHCGLSLKPEDVTPERIAHENEMARRHNTGVHYDSRGNCHTTSRRSQNRELRRRGKMNNDAGYGDYAGR